MKLPKKWENRKQKKEEESTPKPIEPTALDIAFARGTSSRPSSTATPAERDVLDKFRSKSKPHTLPPLIRTSSSSGKRDPLKVRKPNEWEAYLESIREKKDI